ncbi:hypothetical protein LUZ60_005142 [Juncus effusus]|nr:hypothetical protein LUZ60_005142 [Juncus effusus]
METDMRSVDTSPHLTKSKSYESNHSGHFEYTSLKDIIESPTAHSRRSSFRNNSGYELIPGIDPSNINIRNQLVRNVASIYLKSAALIATRDQSFMDKVWEQLHQDRCNLSCVDGSIEPCLPLSSFIAFVRDKVQRCLPGSQSLAHVKSASSEGV